MGVANSGPGIEFGCLESANRVLDPIGFCFAAFGYANRMSSNHDITEDVVFDLVSIQYHALQGAHLYEQFLDDARQADHPEVTEFIEECREADARRANRCHELLKDLTAETDTG